MEVECHRIALKLGAVPRVREWAARLNSELHELHRLLRAEGISVESVFLDQGQDGDFLVYYLRSPDLQRARSISQTSRHPLDLYHQQVMKEVAGSGTKLECLLDASAD